MNKRASYSDILDAHDRMGAGNGDLALAFADNACATPLGDKQTIAYAGFDRVCIPACGQATVDATFDAQYVAISLYFPFAVASQLVATSINFGRFPLLGDCKGVPLDMWSSPEMDNQQFAARLNSANTKICLTVENVSNAKVNFRGGVKAIICDNC